MSEKEILNTIKSTVHTYLPDSRILFFGSRAKGDYKNCSDYDLLVVTKKLLSESEKTAWRNRLTKILVNAIQSPVDLLINSEKEISVKKEFPGHVIQWALKDGYWL